MKWYKLYLEAQVYGVLSPKYVAPLELRALRVLALARRDAAANLLRSREEFYAELKRLSAVSETLDEWQSTASGDSTYRAKASAEVFVQAQKQPLRVLCRLLPRLLSQGN